MKPGFKTTEFWLAMFASLAGPALALLISFGLIDPGVDVDATGGALTQALTDVVRSVTALVGVATPLFASRSYTAARASVKVASPTV